MIKVTLWILFIAFGSYTLFCGLLYVKQRAMLYYPIPAVRSGEAEVFWLENEGHKLKIWQVKRNHGKALLYFGGNAEDVSLNLSSFKDLFSDYSLYLLNYRGYGGSSGSPSEAALFSDALAVFDEVARDYDTIVVMGRSLGTGVAAYLASKTSISRLILVTPFDSMTNLATSHYPFVPVSPLLKDRFESATYLKGSTVPTLVLIAERDEVIPRKHADALVAVLNEQSTQVQTIPSTGHNTIETHPSYEESISTFLLQN